MKKFIMVVIAFLLLWLFLDLYYILALIPVVFIINYKMGDEIKKMVGDARLFIRKKYEANRENRNR